MIWEDLAANALLLVGLLLVVSGVTLISTAVGMIVAGGACLFLAWAIGR